MDAWVIELIRQVPSAAAVIGTVYLFLRWMEKSDERREANSKQRAIEERAHQIEINSLWANSIKGLAEQHEKTAVKTTQMIVEKLGEIDQQYKKMNITQDLIDAINALRNQSPVPQETRKQV